MVGAYSCPEGEIAEGTLVRGEERCGCTQFEEEMVHRCEKRSHAKHLSGPRCGGILADGG